MTSENLIPMMVPRENKGRYIQSSRKRGQRLQDWAKDAMNLQYDFDRFTLGIPALGAFEAYVLAMPLEQVRASFHKIAALDATQEDAIVDVKMVKYYLEKRLAIAQGWEELAGQMQHEIAVDMLKYYHIYPQTSTSLMRVLLDNE